MDDVYTDFWEAFLEEAELPETTVLMGCTYFGGSEAESVEILEQLLRGEKTAVGHCVPAYLTMDHRMPKVGDYTMVTDFYGNPCCILHTKEVVIEQLQAVPEALRRQEMPDKSGEEWMEIKQREFGERARQFGFHYHPELPVLMELVERVYPA